MKSRIVERLDAESGEQMREHGTGRPRVVQRMMGATRIDAEFGTQRDQLVIRLTAVAELAGELQRAQRPTVGEFDSGTPRGGAQESEIERRVVSDQDAVADEIGHDR